MRLCSVPSFVIILLSALMFTTFAIDVARADQPERGLEIHWIDVEGGAATLVITPSGESILFDTGYAKFAGRIHQHLTEVAKVSQIDFLVITHYDGDHYQGAVPLSRMIPIAHLVDNGRFEAMRRDPGEDYFQLDAKNKITINPGDSISLKQSNQHAPLKLRCIATRQQVMAAEPGSKQNADICVAAELKAPDKSENANSTVFVLELGEFRFLDAGDLTWNLEQNLVCPFNLVGKVDVYQVTHHGLDQSNNPLVLRTVQPTVSVMNNGPRKGTQTETVHNLKLSKSIQAMYQLHENERPDGETNNTRPEWIANPAGVTGNYIKLSVTPDGKQYTVSIPARGHHRSFQTSQK